MSTQIYRRLALYGRRHLWPGFSLALFFNFLYGASTGFVPLVIRYLFDDILPSSDRSRVFFSPAVKI